MNSGLGHSGPPWGYALIWLGQFMILDADPWIAKLKWLKKYGLRDTGINIRELDQLPESQQSAIFDFVASNDVGFTLAVWPDYLSPSLDDAKRQADESVKLVEKYREKVRARICTTRVAKVNRFTKEPSFDFQKERLWQLLPDLAEGCQSAGAPLAIENHGDYYVSDLVPFFEEINSLYLFLDTGNTFLIGEQP